VKYCLGIDVGGTFTDLVLLSETTDMSRTAKVLTTPADPSIGALRGVDRLIAEGLDLRAVNKLIHGTTLVANALIERKGAVTGLITTKGFRDVLQFVGRELRYDTYDPNIIFPKPLVPRSLRVEVDERVDGSGAVLRPLEPESARAAIRGLLDQGVEAIAVCFINSFSHPEHEREVAKLVARTDPQIPVSLSHEVFPQIREYERTSATVMNAYVQPLVMSYLHSLEDGLRSRGFAGDLYLMTSTGGILTRETSERFPLQLVESGPAAGALAAAFVAGETGRDDVLSFDMGGTTAKATLIRDGRPLVSRDHEVARIARFKKGSGLPVGITVMDLLEIGAGGGSIASIDSVGLLRVGPQSAGAAPGPACYGLGGTEPTVTDADLLLGFIDADHFLGGEMKLDAAAAEQAILDHVAQPLGLGVVEAAAAINKVVTENMAEAARVHSVEMNVDIRRYGLVAFGGAGPIHACEVARRIGAPFVLCPRNAGVLSAFGLLIAPLAFEASLTKPADVDSLTAEAVDEIVGRLQLEAETLLHHSGAKEIAFERWADMSYIGQGFEVATVLPDTSANGDLAAALKRAFDETYFERYGRRLDDLPARVVTWRVVGREVATPPVAARARGGAGDSKASALKGAREVFFPSVLGATACSVYDRFALSPGDVIQGPAIVEERDSTVVIPPDVRATVDKSLGLFIDLSTADAPTESP